MALEIFLFNKTLAKPGGRMKKLFQIYVMVLVLVEVFLFFGGSMLFDFHRRFYLAGAATALIIAILIFVFDSQAQKIAELEKRLQVLEEKHPTDINNR